MHDSIKIAIAMRTSRAALGMNQAEFASFIGVSKPTIARVEKLETTTRAETYIKLLRSLAKAGVELDTIMSDDIVVRVKPQAILQAKLFLDDISRRRSDRRRHRC